MAKDSMRKATVHSPIGNPAGPGLWRHKGMQLPAYVQHIAKALMRERGLDESRAIATAIAAVKRWAAGGGNVDATTRAAAQKALAEWEKLRAQAKTREAAHVKLLHAASRLAHIVQPLPNQATFSKRYGNRMLEFGTLLAGLRKEQPLAAKMATAMLEAPDGLPVSALVEEIVERKQTTSFLIEALGYGSTPIRAKDGRKGAFHGMHGHERAVRKRTLIPGTVDHPVADAISAGGKLKEAAVAGAPVAPAPVGGGQFDPSKHGRGAGGKFSDMGAGGAQGGSPHNGNAVAVAIQANDPQFQKLQAERAATAGYVQEHPQGAPLAGDQLQSLGYANDPAGIVQFQKDYGVPTSGKLDQATLATIGTVFGKKQTAAGQIPDLTGIKGGGAGVSSQMPTGSRGGAKINESLLAEALAEALGDEPVIIASSRSGAPLLTGPPSGWNDTDSRFGEGGGPDYGFDDDGVPPPNLRMGDGLQMCATCAFFSPGGWVTRRSVQGGCMKFSAQVDRDMVCDDWYTLTPPEVHLRVYEARLMEAEAKGDSGEIVAARAALKVLRESDGAKGLVLREAAAAEAFRLMESATGIVEGVDLSAAGRKAMAKKGHALGDGSFPVPNVEFLKKAIQAYGRAVAAGKGAKVKAHLIRRAQALGAENLLPQGWLPAGS